MKTIDYQIIQQHMQELLRFVRKQTSAEQNVGRVSHSVPSLVVVPSELPGWDETVLKDSGRLPANDRLFEGH